MGKTYRHIEIYRNDRGKPGQVFMEVVAVAECLVKLREASLITHEEGRAVIKKLSFFSDFIRVTEKETDGK